ncbi:MAG TPA: DUF4932 domain-containing protein [Ohtaekwangia sp.]|uniref:DUF4932 domain-containing protein n=1 Tax=Ohtaekwangia sp. TaxID=2066019 RepID=UPI002F9581EA
MKPILFVFAALSLAASVWGQTVEETYPETLWCPNDTFALKFKGNPNLFRYPVSRKDNRSPGTDASLDNYIMVYYGTDSVKLLYNNKIPYAHNLYIRFESPKGKTTLRVHFNSIANYFTPEYMKKNLGNVRFDIPEVYELANIIWTLSPSGQRASDLYNEGEYYKRMIAYFKPYMNHPVLKALDFPDSLRAIKYYDFRENSFAFNFQDPKTGSANTTLLFNGPYYYGYGDELADNSLFGKLKPLVEDFARKSKFRQFYKNNLVYYTKAIEREKHLLPVRQMWSWLEEQFPQSQCQSYRVVFSPLIWRSHSTQRYSTYDYPNNKWFTENVMFICGTQQYDNMRGADEKQKEGLMSGILFTEIDHNYVNPATSHYTGQVDSIFTQRSFWAKRGNSSDFYTSSVSVFNEYMTHAVFCLYILSTYDKSTADYVIRQREELMVENRNFIKFKEFNRELIRLSQEHKDLKAVDLYPYILAWCKQTLPKAEQ